VVEDDDDVEPRPFVDVDLRIVNRNHLRLLQWNKHSTTLNTTANTLPVIMRIF
jgi:hypothetical protein